MHGLRREAAMRDEFVVERGEKFSSVRAAVGFADVNARDGDAGLRKALEHPALFFAGQPRESWRIADPRCRLVRRFAGGWDDESWSALDLENLAGEWQGF